MMQTAVRSPLPSTRLGVRTPYRVRTPHTELVALGMLGVLVIGAPQLFGGVFPWTVLVIASMALATLGATLWAVRDSRPQRTPWVVLAICGAAAWTCVQTLPLPCWLVSQLAPDAVAELRAVLSLAGAPSPAWCTLSRDPGATQLEVLKGVAIVSSFLSAWWLSAHGARARVISLVAFSTLAMSVVAHAHMVLGLHEVFGVYRPVDTAGGLQLAPLMNPNNLGGFAAFGVPIWLGIVRRDREMRMRVIAVFAVVLCAATAMFSLSRGAIAVLLGGAALFIVFQRGQSGDARKKRKRTAGRWRARLGVSAALALGIALGAYIALDRVLLEFQHGGADKLTLIAGSLRFAARHPWLGVGRGAFASTYTARGDRAFFEYSENFFTQWASDWGFPVALALLLALGHALWRAFRGDESLRRFGAIVGIVCLATQNLFDMGLELAGVAVAAATLLGAAVAPSKPTTRTEEPGRLAARWFTTGSLGVAGIALAWLGPSVARDSVDQLDAALRARIETHNRNAFAAVLERAVRLHPVEPRFAVLAAAESIAHGEAQALRWINRGMRLAPGWTAPHVQAFQWLWLTGHRDQALLEMRVAAEIDPSAVATYACAVAHVGSGTILQAAPRKNREQRAAFIEQASSCMGAEQPVSQELDRVLLREFPERPAAGEREAVRLAHQGDLDAALRELGSVLRKNPARVATRTLKASLLFEGKRYAEAARSALELARSIPLEEAAPLWRMRARALAALNDDAGWADALAVLRGIPSLDSDQLADTYALEGQLHLQRQQPGAALRAYRAAYRIKEDPNYLRIYADISTQLGDQASALWAYMELCQRDPNNASFCAKRDALIERARGMNLGGRLRN